jgi:hypothetical protein
MHNLDENHILLFSVVCNTQWDFALFTATVMTTSTMPVTAKILQKMHPLKPENIGLKIDFLVYFYVDPHFPLTTSAS